MNKNTAGQVIWCKFVRITHWVTALVVVFNFFNETGWLHRYAGYLAAVMVVLRLAYGLPIFARWLKPERNALVLLPGKKEIFHHIADLHSGRVVPSNGHNPLGQLAVLIMWSLIILLAVSGWVATTDAYWGEDLPIELHTITAYILELVVVIHLVGVVVMSKLLKVNLVKAMITGKRKDHVS